MAQLNVCSIRNKVHELNYPTTENTIRIWAVSERPIWTLLFLTKRFPINGYNMFRRNKHGVGIALLYIRNNFTATLCSEFVSDSLESNGQSASSS